MLVGKEHFRTIWLDSESGVVKIIDQRWLPHQFIIEDIRSVEQMATAIRDMHVRGAGLIGAAAAFGMYLAAHAIKLPEDLSGHLKGAATQLMHTRPTAVNLAWAVRRQLAALLTTRDIEHCQAQAKQIALNVADEDAEACRKIGQFGLPLIQALAEVKHPEPVNILTHCNAGWLAFVDYGSATAPIYAAHDAGLNVHVWVDETRPRNQGARLTAWELHQHGVPHTIIADNVGGHLMQEGKVDLVMTGTDRTTKNGDVANKIGTYLKALAAADNKVPFYVALPSSSFDWELSDGSEIPIEQRGSEEVKYIQGLGSHGVEKVLLTPPESQAINYGFDVTPSRLITGLITERGICKADAADIGRLFPMPS